MKHGFALQFCSAKRRKAIDDCMDRGIWDGNQNDRSGKDPWRQVSATAAATNRTNSATRGGLAAGDHRVNLPTLLTQTAAQRSTNSSRTDNGNRRFPHYARIPCGTI